MKQVKIVPYGFKCSLSECPPGLFLHGLCLGFKTEYGQMECFVVESGEAFWGGTDNKKDLAKLNVQPCIIEEEEIEI